LRDLRADEQLAHVRAAAAAPSSHAELIPLHWQRGAAMKHHVEVGYQAFVSDGGEEFGAVRQVLPGELVVYVENTGDLVFPMDAVEKVHFQKVVFSASKLDERLLEAIRHAHDAEQPGL
jgi:hypothetical protein